MTSDLGSELRSMYARRGKLTPELVVEESRPPEAPLHNRFEWDDSVAAEAWRHHQAGGLIRSIFVEYAENDDGSRRSARKWLPITRDSGDGPERTYAPSEEVLADPLLGRMTLRQMEREAKAFRSKWQNHQEFAAIVAREFGGGEAA
jgi:hypothetical protein